MAVSTKMSVDVSDFKKGMAEATDAAKTLDAMMKQNESSFKVTGDKANYLAAQMSLLEGKLEAAKKKVAAATSALEAMRDSGVKETDKAYQSMLRTLASAQTDLNNTQAKINDLGKESTEAAKGTDALSQSVANIGKNVSLENLTNAIGKIRSGLEGAVRSGKKLVGEVLDAGSWADDLNTRSMIWGISTDELQRMEKTADIIDVSVDTILKSRQKLMTGVGNGTKTTMDLLTALGISYDGDAEKAFWDAGQALMNLGDEAEQEAAATKLFGKSWKELIPLFAAGREEYERINSSWKTLSDEQIKTLTDLDDKYQTLKNDLETTKMELMSKLAEPLGWLIDNEGAAVAAITAVGGALGLLKVSDAVLTVVKLFAALKGVTGGGGTSSVGDVTKVTKGIFGKTGDLIATLLGGSGLTKAGDLVAAGGVTTLQNFAPFFADWVMHNTPMGQWLMGTTTPEQTMKEFTSNWDANNPNANILMQNAANMIRFWDNFYKPKEAIYTPGSMEEADWRPSYMKDQQPVTIETQPVAPDDAAEQIAGEIGTVTVPVALVPQSQNWLPSYMQGFGNHANGLPFVPYDGYLARLHKGERVVTAREAASRSFSSNLYVENMNMSGGLSADALAAAIAGRNRRMMTGYGS